MRCDSCNERDATVHHTEINGAEKREIHLCEECSQRKLGPLSKMADFADVLTSLLHGAAKTETAAGNAVCPTCGISLAEFRATGRFGCPNDYRVFEEFIMPLVEKIQHGDRHVGKVPSNAGIELQRENEMIRLRRELERAVQREEYHEAAALRDRIRELSGSDGDAAR